MSDDGGQAMSGFVCRGCKNYFLQDRLCTTCGAGKLYDATVESQAAEIERLREVIRTIRARCVELDDSDAVSETLDIATAVLEDEP